PGQVEGQGGPVDARRVESRVELLERPLGALQARRIADDADVVPHDVVEPFAYLLDIAGLPAQRSGRGSDRLLDRRRIRLVECSVGAQPPGHRIAGDTAENRRVGDAVAAQPVRAVHAAGVLARDEQARELAPALAVEHYTAHHVVRRRDDFDQSPREIEAAVGAALDHALELLAHALGPE